MEKSVLIFILFIFLHAVFGSKMKTVDEWTTRNNLKSDLHLSRGKLYQARASSQKLTLLSVEKKSPTNCTVTDRRIDNLSTHPRGIKHLGNGKTLVVFDAQVIVLDAKLCTITAVVSTECKIVFPRQDSFDCYPPGILDIVTKRFSDRGELIDAIGIGTVYYGYGEYAEFEKPTENRSYFMWEDTSHENSWSVLKTANSSYGIVRRDYLGIKRSEYFSLAHGNFTGCVPWFGDGDYVECAMVDWTVAPTRNVTVKVNAGKSRTSGKRKIAVLNLPAGGAILLHGGKRVYCGIIDARGRVSDEQELFYEFEKLDGHGVGLHLYERGGDVCGVMVSQDKIVTRCVNWEDEVTVWKWVKNAVSRVFNFFK